MRKVHRKVVGAQEIPSHKRRCVWHRATSAHCRWPRRRPPSRSSRPSASRRRRCSSTATSPAASTRSRWRAPLDRCKRGSSSYAACCSSSRRARAGSPGPPHRPRRPQPAADRSIWLWPCRDSSQYAMYTVLPRCSTILYSTYCSKNRNMRPARCHSSFPSDFSFESCLSWCEKSADNCQRCKCRLRRMPRYTPGLSVLYKCSTNTKMEP